MAYASGKHALGLCDLCGLQFKLKQLKPIVNNGVLTSHKACPECWSPDHPQNFVNRVVVDDAIALRDPRPETYPADLLNISWAWNPVFSFEMRSELGTVTIGGSVVSTPSNPDAEFIAAANALHTTLGSMTNTSYW